MGKNGGKREGAGRPSGHKDLIKISDYFTNEEKIELIELAKKQSKNNYKMVQYLLDQLCGKAPQRIELSNPEGEVFMLQISEKIAKKNNLNATA